MRAQTLCLRMRAEARPHLAAAACPPSTGGRCRFPCRPGMRAGVTQRDDASSAFGESPQTRMLGCAQSALPSRRTLCTDSLSDSASQTQCLKPLCGVFCPRFLRVVVYYPGVRRAQFSKCGGITRGPAHLQTVLSHPMLPRTLAFSARRRRRGFILFKMILWRDSERRSRPVDLVQVGERERESLLTINE
jgi:hypothetical protein